MVNLKNYAPNIYLIVGRIAYNTEENLSFALSVEPGNESVRKRLLKVKNAIGQNLPTVPAALLIEKETNPFLRSGNPELKKALGMENASDVEVFAELRRRKDRY